MELQDVKDWKKEILPFLSKNKKSVFLFCLTVSATTFVVRGWGGVDDPRVLQNQFDNRSTITVDQNEALTKQRESIDEYQAQIYGYIRLNSQKAEIQLANIYRSLAVYFSNDPSHPMYGKGSRAVIEGFRENRIAGLLPRSHPDNLANDPAVTFNFVLEQYGELTRLKAWELARILETPEELRTPIQQQWLVENYPDLKNLQNPADLAPDNVTLAKYLTDIQAMINSTQMTSANESLVQLCLQQPEEKRILIPACDFSK